MQQRRKGGSKRKLKNDECGKRKVCLLACLIKINDWTHYHSRDTLQKERKSEREGDERTAKGKERMIKERVTEKRVRKEGRGWKRERERSK